MEAPGSDELDDPYGMLVDCLQDPAAGKSRLPRIVGLFESDERVTRLCAAWACCLLATEIEDDDTIEYLVRRLSDRLDAEYVSLELTTTLDYISTLYSEQVETILDEMDEEERDRGDIPLPRVGNFTRANYYSRDHTRQGVGRTRVAGGDDAGDPRAAYADRVQEEREQTERERERDPDHDEGDADDETPADSPAAAGGGSGPMAQQRSEVSSIATRSRFDKLHILATRERSRYADVYEALVGQSGEEQAVALRLLHRPEGDGARLQFGRRVERELANWAAVSDNAHVVSVLDWSVEPRPWVATQFTGEPLSEIGRIPPEQVLADGIDLAGAVSSLHRRGVVHGGIDPGNVIYPEDVVESPDNQPPFLDNVGLVNAFRFHFQPTLMLDPRFAAPEYFDRQYGRIGPATDVYHLGAVLFYMVTGQPPYSGQFEQVRDDVLDAETPVPSRIDDEVPAALDDVVAKAMATQKLTRYETVEHLEQELSGIRGGAPDG